MQIGLDGEQLTLQEASRILTAGDWTEDDICPHCERVEAVCNETMCPAVAAIVAETDEARGLVQQVIDAEMQKHQQEQINLVRENIEGMDAGDKIEFVTDNIDVLDYNTLTDDLKEVYDAIMESETQSG